MTDAEGEQMTSDEGVRPNSSVEKLATLKTISPTIPKMS
jgi:acetyl-CoA C-acetyltransferase